jgi:peptidyl-prolyl cis-trans isomerase B (cyclophilin B)
MSKQSCVVDVRWCAAVVLAVAGLHGGAKGQGAAGFGEPRPPAETKSTADSKPQETKVGPAVMPLVPTRMYVGVGQSLVVKVEPPAVTEVVGAERGETERLELQLFTLDDPKLLGKVAVKAGMVDVAALFPVIWEGKSSKVLFVQLLQGGKAVGSALVLAPMLNPVRASLEPAGEGKRPTVKFSARPKEDVMYAGVRVWVDQRVRFEVELATRPPQTGVIEIAPRFDVAPNTAWTFLHLAQEGFYTEIPVHRVVPLDSQGRPFVIQAGDPTGSGSGGPGFDLDLEQSSLEHDLGVVSMARAGDVDSAGSQFFICLSRAGTQRLDGAYTAFGVVTEGLEMVRVLSKVPLLAGTDRPIATPMIRKATVIPAPALAAGKPAQVQREKSKPVEGGNPAR